MLAQVIGKLVATQPGVPVAPLFYKTLENIKTDKLKQFYGNYEARIIVSPEIKCYLNWWILNLQGWHSCLSMFIVSAIISTESNYLPFNEGCVYYETLM